MKPDSTLAIMDVQNSGDRSSLSPVKGLWLGRARVSTAVSLGHPDRLWGGENVPASSLWPVGMSQAA